MNPHYQEWLNLLLRWSHFTFGIAWIGASFYFNWLENNLNRRVNLREELAGNLWAVHGGGFYYLEKYRGAPQKLPEELHWFKWEAYFTWISGFLLLILVYYLNPSAYLLSQDAPQISAGGGIAISIASLIFGWMIYDMLCCTALVERGALFALIGYGLITLVAWGYGKVFSPRAAFLHAGALIGTIMVANVFRVIIPSQKELVSAALRNTEPDAAVGKKALRRSRHNNYLTLPVLFVMLSSHFPATYGHEYGWLVFSALVLISVSVRHYFNIRKTTTQSILILPVALAAMAGLAALTAPRAKSGKEANRQTTIHFSQVNSIIYQRCNTCHSAAPRDPLFLQPPNGITFDTPSQIKAQSERIRARAVESKTMPLANLTGMTDEERAVLDLWISNGALID